MTEDTRVLGEGIGAEVKGDEAKFQGEGSPQKTRPWWKVWARK